MEAISTYLDLHIKRGNCREKELIPVFIIFMFSESRRNRKSCFGSDGVFLESNRSCDQCPNRIG